MQKPDGVTIDTSEQGTEPWRQARLGKFTASRAGDLMKTQRNGKPYATRKNYITEIALERITMRVPENIESEAMREGKERERTAALAYSFATGNETEQTGFWHTDTWGASPDDLVGKDGGVEYKNPQAATHYQTLMMGEVPEHYYWQVIQCLMATSRDWWDYVSFHPDFPENAQLFIKRIWRADNELAVTRLAQEIGKASAEVEDLIKQVKDYK